jgi:cysteine-rich repeat protein
MRRSLMAVCVLLAGLAQAALGQTAGPNAPGTVVSDASIGTAAWTLPMVAAASDDLRALAPLSPSQYLKATNFGFALPPSAVIEGIVVDAERSSLLGTVTDARARIVKNGVIGAAERALAGAWPQTDAVASYGTDSDLWGDNWTAADINNAGFGFALAAGNPSLDTAMVDAISVTVFYSVCGDNGVGASEECDDGNAADGDCCSSTCQFDLVGAACPDSDLCDGTELCDGAGSCGAGPPLDCDDGNPCTVDTCNTLDGCQSANQPQTGCRTAQKSILLYKDKLDDTKDKLVWKWVKGAATATQDFGLPTGTTAYSLCLYAGTAALGDASIAPGSGWTPLSTKGFKYKDTGGSSDGVTKAILKSGAAGKAKAQVKGKGANLPDLGAMPFDSPVIVQLNGSNGVCLESIFTEPFRRNIGGTFKAKTP